MKGKILENILWLLIGVVYLFCSKYEDSVVFLDVGQGDATLIQRGSMQMVVDGGPDSKILYEIGKYMPFYDGKIEYLVLTHPHDDHLVGLLELQNRFEVGTIFYYPVCFENGNYKFLLQNFNNLYPIKKGDTIRIKDIDIQVLWPMESQTEEECILSYDGNINNDSLVLSFNYLNYKFLLMGDIEKEVEYVLVRNQMLQDEYDVLKGGHHCSKTSNSETFLNLISPNIAVCSLGERNRFGHPSSETLKNFSKYGVQYLLTSQEGNIQIK